MAFFRSGQQSPPNQIFVLPPMKNNILCTLAALSSFGVIVAAVVTPVTDQNRVPMVAAIVLGGVVIPYGAARLSDF